MDIYIKVVFWLLVLNVVLKPFSAIRHGQPGDPVNGYAKVISFFLVAPFLYWAFGILY